MVEKHSKKSTADEKLNMQDVLSMRSSGYYSQRTAGAKNAIDSVLPLMKEAVKNLPETEILRFADFGAADGGTSAALWSHLISALRKSGDKRHTELLYTDLPSNYGKQSYYEIVNQLRVAIETTQQRYDEKWNKYVIILKDNFDLDKWDDTYTVGDTVVDLGKKLLVRIKSYVVATLDLGK